jgi:hypothetical protein
VQVSPNAAFAVNGPVEAEPEVGLIPLQLPEAVQLVESVDVQVRLASEPELTVDGAAKRVMDGPSGADGD